MNVFILIHVMVRIKGKNTIEMIKALTELEVIQVGVNKRPLSNKGNSLKSNRGTFAQIYRIS